MRKLRWVILALAFLAASALAMSTLAARFAWKPAFVDVGTPIQFINKSEGATQWVWQFSDGFVTDEKNPVHIFTTPGLISVRLMAGNDDGDTRIKQKSLIVYPGLMVDFTWSPSTPVETLPVQFIDTSVGETIFPTVGPGALSWRWDFGDGMTSDEQNPVHVYAKAGKYVVTLTITPDGGGRKTRTKIV